MHPRPHFGSPAPRRPRPRSLLLGFFLLLALTITAHAQTESVSREYRIKAGFLYNFTKFVEWPADRFATNDSPLVIAVLGHNPFGDTLEAAVKNRVVNNRRVEVRLVQSASEAVGAHVLFVASGEEALLPASPDALRGVLTVGESAAFSNEGGIIRFTLLDEKVRFEINQFSGEQAGLRLSAQLLKLATSVRTKP